MKTRRKFLGASARFAVVGGIIAFVLAQEQKRRRLENDPACVRLNPCEECGKFQLCALPKAKDARSSQRLSSSATARLS